MFLLARRVTRERVIMTMPSDSPLPCLSAAKSFCQCSLMEASFSSLLRTFCSLSSMGRRDLQSSTMTVSGLTIEMRRATSSQDLFETCAVPRRYTVAPSFVCRTLTFSAMSSSISNPSILSCTSSAVSPSSPSLLRPPATSPSPPPLLIRRPGSSSAIVFLISGWSSWALFATASVSLLASPANSSRSAFVILACSRAISLLSMRL
mmetsp:Transcript_10830/g.44343  ORF Transcript_10830/g.44343 Transcript_10830/m.44343 type:complete len:206 (+) Transcript_10830:618-1235(+)